MLEHSSRSQRKIFEGSGRLWVLFFTFIVISALLGASALSSDIYKASSLFPYIKHFMIIGVGVGFTWVISRVPTKYYPAGTLLYFLLVVVMITMLYIGLGVTINGATRWINFGICTIQPSEFFKLSIILSGALIGKAIRRTPQHRNKLLGIYLGVYLLLSGAILRDNMSTGALCIVLIFLMLIFIKAPRKLLVTYALLCGMAGGMVKFVMPHLPDSVLSHISPRAITWKNRMNREKYKDITIITDENMQEKYGLIALSYGQFVGVGPGKSKMKKILPMASSDFIYAVIVEECGIVGILGIPLLYVLWFLAAGALEQHTHNKYHSYILLGIGVLYPLQALINIAVVAGFGNTGQTLPFISSGGSSLFAACIAMGIMIAISREQQLAISNHSDTSPQTLDSIDQDNE